MKPRFDVLLAAACAAFLAVLALPRAQSDGGANIWFEAEDRSVERTGGWLFREGDERAEDASGTAVACGAWASEVEVAFKFPAVPDGEYEIFVRLKRMGRCSGNIRHSLDGGDTWRRGNLDLEGEYKWFSLGREEFSGVSRGDFQIKIANDTKQGYPVVDLFLLSSEADYSPPDGVKSILEQKEKSERAGRELAPEIVNSGFEGAVTEAGMPERGWVLEGERRGVMEVDVNIARSGRQSFKISLDEPYNSGITNEGFRPELKPGTRYTVEGYVKTEGVEGNGAGIFIQQYRRPGGPGGWVANTASTRRISGTSDWIKLSTDFVTPPDQPFFLHLKLHLHNSTGTAWWDDIKIIEIADATPFPASHEGVYFREDFHGTVEDGRIESFVDSGYSGDPRRTEVRIVTKEDGVPLSEGGRALSISGANLWNGGEIILPRGIPLTQEIFLKCDFWTSGAGNTIGLQVADRNEPFTNLWLGPGRVNHYGRQDGRWNTAVWRLNDYFPEYQYENPEEIIITRIRFLQRVAGGGEKSDGIADWHQLVVDNIEIASGEDAEPVRKLIDELAGHYYYTGSQSYVVPGAIPGAGGITVWHSPSTAKVFEDQPVPAAAGGPVFISGARNEHESFQLVLRSDEKAGGLSVSPGRLAGPGGAGIPAENVRWHPVFYLPIHARYFGIACAQRWPGPLSWNRTFDCSPGKNQPVWFTVYIPRGIPAGDYEGEIKIQQDGKVLGAVPYSVRVWDFELPDRMNFKTNMQVWGQIPNPWDTRDRNEWMEDAAKTLAMYRMFDANMFLRYPPNVRKMNDEHCGINTVKLRGAYGHRGGASKKVHRVGGHLPYEEGYEEAVVKDIQNLKKRLEPYGLWDSSFLYIWDEPFGDFEVVEMIQYIAGISRKHFPGLKTLVAAPAYEELMDGIDIFLASYSAGEERRKALEKGKEFWWWANAQTYIDMPGIDQRMAWGFESVQRQVSGAYAWGIHVPRTGQRAIKNNPEHPDWAFTDPWKLPARANYAPMALWPGGRAESEPERFVPSIPLELLRDGIEDYEYVIMLKSKIEELEGAGNTQQLRRARGVLGKCRELFSEPEYARKDFGAVDELAQLRVEIASILEN